MSNQSHQSSQNEAFRDDDSESPSEELTRRTFHAELWRSIPVGILETTFSTFAILIALRVFDASDSQKALLLSSSQVGLLASLFVVPIAERLPFSPPRLQALLALISTLGFLVAAIWADSLVAFLAGTSFGFFVMMAQIPMQTRIYQENFPDSKRGRLFSIISVLRGLVSVVFAVTAGEWLDRDLLQAYRPLLWLMALMAFFTAVVFWFMPERKSAAPRRRPRLLAALGFVRTDPAFRTLLLSWMLMGLGNLMNIRLWVEYMGNPEFGLNFTEKRIAFLTIIVPTFFRLITTFYWGKLFDRVNFYFLRIVMNLGFLIAILCIFWGSSYWWILLGVIVQGIAFGGGNIAWSLWVTKIAPEEHTSAYMSVHTFTTGLRGTIAPFLGFWLLGTFGNVVFSIVLALLVLLSCLIILPEAKIGPARRTGKILAPGQD